LENQLIKSITRLPDYPITRLLDYPIPRFPDSSGDEWDRSVPPGQAIEPERIVQPEQEAQSFPSVRDVDASDRG
jgi:hypothetical protein